MEKIFIFLAFLILPVMVFSQFRVSLHKKQNTYLLTWNQYQGDSDLLVGYKIYLSEGYTPGSFPNSKIDSVGKLNQGWESVERKSYKSIGLDIRSFDQWGDPKVMTPGFAYTIGVERVTKNSVTMNQEVQRAVCYVLPFEFFSAKKFSTKGSKKIAPSKFLILPEPIQSFIRKKDDTVYFTFKNKSSPIEAILEYNDFFIFKLNDQLVKYQKPPHRTEAFGSPKLIRQSLGVVILCFTGTLVIGFIYITIKALIALNYMSNHIDRVNVILAEIIDKEMFSVLIIYMLVLFTSDSIISKLVNMLLKKVILVDVNIFKDKFEVISAIAEVYNENSLFQHKKIKSEILNIL